MRRREKFLISSLLLALGLLATQYIPLEYRWLGAAVLFLIAYFVSAWALLEDLGGVEWLTIVPMPAFYAAFVSLFYFLLPENALSRLLILGLFGVGMYGIYLTCNIYSVAKSRTIQLLRAAHAMGLFATLVMMFLISNTIFSLRLPFWANAGLLGASALPLSLMSLWSMELKPILERRLIRQTLVIGYLSAGLAAVISFFPANIWTSSLMMVGLLYVCLGMFTAKIAGKLFQNTALEYVIVAVVMVLAFFLQMNWK